MKTDYHIHSHYSADSETTMEEMVQKGISLGLTTMCFTEHQDYDYPGETPFLLDTDAYLREFELMKVKYSSQIELLFGLELGLQTHLAKRLQDYVDRYPFDFIIGSSHLVNGQDPCHPTFFEGRDEGACYMEYFHSIVENLKGFTNFSVYGHIDYVIRYGPNKNKYYSYKKYSDVIDKILSMIIEKELGLELNTAGFKYGLGHPHPHEDVLKRYKELGGEIITVGSDGHQPGHLAYDFRLADEILKHCGFGYYTVFRDRKPEFIRLS